MLTVLTIGIIQAVASAANAFWVPSFIGVEQYGYLRAYFLYAGYIGVLHFGFSDGILIKYSGKSIEQTDRNSIKQEHGFLLLFQIAVSILTIIIGALQRDFILMLFGLTILPSNLLNFISTYFLAIGKLGYYSVIRLIPVFNLAINAALIFFRIKNYIYYSLAFFFSTMIAAGYVEYVFGNLFKGFFNFKFNIPNIKKLFIIGIFVLFGNFFSLIFFSIDRWGVYFYFENKDFAFYSFALSLMQIINLLVLSISITFYPYLAKEENRESILKYNKFLLLLSGLSMSIYFVLAYIVKRYIHDFSTSLPLLNILIISAPALIISNSIFINLLKKNDRFKRYTAVFGIFSVIGIAVNFIVIKTFKNMEAIAICNIILYYLFLFFSSVTMKIGSLRIKDFLFILIIIATYSISFVEKNEIKSGFIYFASMSVVSFIFYYKFIISILKELSAATDNFLKKRNSEQT
jgi:O-antigen/teichoic acid export membrane protein